MIVYECNLYYLCLFVNATVILHLYKFIYFLWAGYKPSPLGGIALAALILSLSIF